MYFLIVNAFFTVYFTCVLNLFDKMVRKTPHQTPRSVTLKYVKYSVSFPLKHVMVLMPTACTCGCRYNIVGGFLTTIGY